MIAQNTWKPNPCADYDGLQPAGDRRLHRAAAGIARVAEGPGSDRLLCRRGSPQTLALARATKVSITWPSALLERDAPVAHGYQHGCQSLPEGRQESIQRAAEPLRRLRGRRSVGFEFAELHRQRTLARVADKAAQLAEPSRPVQQPVNDHRLPRQASIRPTSRRGLDSVERPCRSHGSLPHQDGAASSTPSVGRASVARRRARLGLHGAMWPRARTAAELRCRFLRASRQADRQRILRDWKRRSAFLR